jgi:hypothetical protein
MGIVILKGHHDNFEHATTLGLGRTEHLCLGGQVHGFCGYFGVSRDRSLFLEMSRRIGIGSTSHEHPIGNSLDIIGKVDTSSSAGVGIYSIDVVVIAGVSFEQRLAFVTIVTNA